MRRILEIQNPPRAIFTRLALLCAFFHLVLPAQSFASGADSTTRDALNPEAWRAEHRIIDLHQHLDYEPELLKRAVQVMDAAGVGIGVDLTPGTTTPGPGGGPSEFKQHKNLEERLFPGRWVQYMNLDYRNWDQPDFAEQAVRQVEAGHKLGAAGFKEWKRLGLYLRDGAGKLIRVDDPKLDPMWERLGQLDMPVSIHVADPKAFFQAYEPRNERWKELKDHPSWWFGDTNKFPTFHELLGALNKVISRHPHTIFVCVHFGNDAEELDWVEQSLSRYPNMYVDLAARIPELGRHDPGTVRKLFIEYQDRILFGTDFQSLAGRMILGSSGSEPPPSLADAEVFFSKEWRWLETTDRNWPHMTPIQGDWTISSINLPPTVLRKIYFDNARRLLARSLPLPLLKARRTTVDFALDGDAGKSIWRVAKTVRIEYLSRDSVARPELSTTVRAVWSQRYLYLCYECPYTKLTTFEPAQTGHKRYDLGKEGVSLWDRDVVEAFVGSNPEAAGQYAEFEVSPTNERLDVKVDLPEKDFGWSSGFESAVRINKQSGTWSCEMRIPMQALRQSPPRVGERWRLNLFRGDRANHAAMAWSPTLTGSFHEPTRFGFLEFIE